MKTAVILCGLMLAALAVPSRGQDPYADTVISYVPGTGQSTSFENSGAALGAPTGSATITAPPFSSTGIVGIGNGGELTLEFNSPILDDPSGHAFGMDFTVFGNEFFVNGTSGFAGVFNHTGLSVWVSQDNVNYYQLNSTVGADDYYPTAGSGDSGLPVDPALTLSSFTGLSASQALSLYAGSAGGASYSIGSAVDGSGNPVNLPEISYVRIEGTGGFGYVDAVARVESVPEPGPLVLLVMGILGLGSMRISKRNK